MSSADFLPSILGVKKIITITSESVPRACDCLQQPLVKRACFMRNVTGIKKVDEGVI